MKICVHTGWQVITGRLVFFIHHLKKMMIMLYGSTSLLSKTASNHFLNFILGNSSLCNIKGWVISKVLKIEIYYFFNLSLYPPNVTYFKFFQ